MKQLRSETEMVGNDVSLLLVNKYNIENIRYIVLTVILHESRCCADKKLSSKTRVIDYLLSQSNIIPQISKLHSLQLMLSAHNSLLP